jgi:hypothetical protein
MFMCTLPVLLWSEGVKTSEADDLQQVHKFFVQAGSFAVLKCASAFCVSRCCNSQTPEILTSHTSPNNSDLFPSYYHMFGQLKEALHG